MTSKSFWEGLIGDRHSAVRSAANAHREAHDCDAFPTGRSTAAMAQWLVRTTGSKRVLELGTGLGYLTLHLADALAPSAKLVSIERNPVHAQLAQANIAQAGQGHLVRVQVGDIEQVIPGLEQAIDLAIDDAWFLQRPPWLDPVLGLLRPGGVLLQTNWFALDLALANNEQVRPDWTERYGPNWPLELQSYAGELASRQDVDATLLAGPVAMLLRRTAVQETMH